MTNGASTVAGPTTRIVELTQAVSLLRRAVKGMHLLNSTEDSLQRGMRVTLVGEPEMMTHGKRNRKAIKVQTKIDPRGEDTYVFVDELHVVEELAAKPESQARDGIAKKRPSEKNRAKQSA